MSPTPLFSALSSNRLAALIRSAESRVVYAAPGIQDFPANALMELRSHSFPPELTISLDFDERTIRMGYGSLEAVEMLRKGGIELTHFPGFRSGVLIVDKRGWIFTPVARYLEDEPQSDETPNAMELSPAQVEAFAIRFSPVSRKEAIKVAPTPETAAALDDMPVELGVVQVEAAHFEEVKKAIETAPPVKFDVVRQVRVFEPYLQYVEMSLTGAAIQKRKLVIPPKIQNLGTSKELDGRLRTTFDLILKSSKLSSADLEKDLKDIRENLTRSLGQGHGRVVLKSNKQRLEMRIGELRGKLAAHQQRVRETLDAELAESQKQVVDFYLPLVKAKPPDAVYGQSPSGQATEEECRHWITQLLGRVFPTADKLIGAMNLEIIYKDVTFESLNRPDFLDAVKKAFANDENWDKLYDEFKAAGETVKTQ
jgi:hypothetical protein